MAKVTATVETITPEMAVEYLKNNDGNRKINKAQVQYYARLLREGQWMLNGETIIFGENGKLSNGQHRLNAIIEANVPMQTVVVRNVVDEAFLTIDKGKVRSSADSLNIKGISNSTLIAAIIRRYILLGRRKVSSLSTVAHGSGTVSDMKISDVELVEIYKKNPTFWQDEAAFGVSCYNRCRLLMKAEVSAISAYLQLDKGYDMDYVHEFFQQLFFEEVTKNGTLRNLRKKLVDDAMKSGNVRMTPKYKMQLLIKTWEAYKDDRVIEVLKWNSKTERERIFE